MEEDLGQDLVMIEGIIVIGIIIIEEMIVEDYEIIQKLKNLTLVINYHRLSQKLEKFIMAKFPPL